MKSERDSGVLGSMAGETVEESMPGYLQLCSTACSVVWDAYRDCKDCGIKRSVQTLVDHAHLTCSEILLFFLCLVMWTCLRWALTHHLFVVCYCMLRVTQYV